MELVAAGRSEEAVAGAAVGCCRAAALPAAAGRLSAESYLAVELAAATKPRDITQLAPIPYCTYSLQHLAYGSAARPAAQQPEARWRQRSA
jgi:hypothetical protein